MVGVDDIDNLNREFEEFPKLNFCDDLIEFVEVTAPVVGQAINNVVAVRWVMRTTVIVMTRGTDLVTLDELVMRDIETQRLVDLVQADTTAADAVIRRECGMLAPTATFGTGTLARFANAAASKLGQWLVVVLTVLETMFELLLVLAPAAKLFRMQVLGIAHSLKAANRKLLVALANTLGIKGLHIGVALGGIVVIKQTIINAARLDRTGRLVSLARVVAVIIVDALVFPLAMALAVVNLVVAIPLDTLMLLARVVLVTGELVAVALRVWFWLALCVPLAVMTAKDFDFRRST
jgi:hypothetical protein